MRASADPFRTLPHSFSRPQIAKLRNATLTICYNLDFKLRSHDVPRRLLTLTEPHGAGKSSEQPETQAPEPLQRGEGRSNLLK